MAVRRRSRIISQRSNRQPLWLGVIITPLDVAASTDVLLGSLNATALAFRPFTIIRTRLQVMYSSDQITASETPFGVLGQIIVRDSATAAGVASLPDPGTDTDADWFVYQPVMAEFAFTTGVGYRNVDHQYTVDSKAMRKVGPDDDAGLVFSQNAAVGGTITIVGRQLIKLH